MTRSTPPEVRLSSNRAQCWAGLMLGAFLALLAAKPAAACLTPRLVNSHSGEAIAGPEDLVALPDGRGIIISAYDRWAVSDAVTANAERVPRGGLYYIPAAALGPARDTLAAEPLLDPTFLDLRPHGITLWAGTAPPRLAVINRRQDRANGRWRQNTVLEIFSVHGRADSIGLAHRETIESPMLCRANDVAALDGERWLVTRDRGSCQGLGRVIEDLFGLRRGHLLLAGADGVRSLTGPTIGFANGIAARPSPKPGYWDVYVGATRERQIRRYRYAAAAERVQERIPLLVPAAPDNLSWVDEDTLLVAAHPSLIALAAYRARLPVIGGAPSAVYAVDTEEVRSAAPLYRDNGAATAGATAAVKVQDLLIIGSAFDSRLTICRTGGR